MNNRKYVFSQLLDFLDRGHLTLSRENMKVTSTLSGLSPTIRLRFSCSANFPVGPMVAEAIPLKKYEWK